MDATLGVAALPGKALEVVTQAAFGGAGGRSDNLLYSGGSISGATWAGPGPHILGLPPFELEEIFQLPTMVGGSSVTPTVLYAFSGPDGARPNGSLVADAQGNLYGTTRGGRLCHARHGLQADQSPRDRRGLLTILHTFTGPDGANPAAGVTFGPDGSLLAAHGIDRRIAKAIPGKEHHPRQPPNHGRKSNVRIRSGRRLS
ncbi:MAG TPA: hypothetical protein VKQ29_11790 [Aliidongia sp.]|nr:hypothetical protein [Aliidongia sp.]